MTATMSISRSVSVPAAPRSALRDRLVQSLAAGRNIILEGPRFWGKTTLARSIHAVAKGRREDFTEVVSIDFLPVQCPEIQQLEQHLEVRLATGSDVDGQQSSRADFKNRLEKQLGSRGLLILDHAETLLDNTGKQRWLANLIRQGIKKGMIVLALVEDAKPFYDALSETSRNDQPDFETFQMPCLTEEEIREWDAALDDVGLSCFSNTSIEDVLRITQGMVGLTRDFILFQASRRFPLQDALNRFVEMQERQYSPLCHAVLCNVMAHPDEAAGWRAPESRELNDTLLKTGAFETSEHGIEIRSKVHQQRLLQVLTPENIAVAFTPRGPEWAKLHTQRPQEPAAVGKRSYPLEVVVESFVRHCERLHGSQIFHETHRFLSVVLRTQVSIHIVDSTHAKIWHSVIGTSRGAAGTWLMDRETRPHESLAVLTGQRVTQPADEGISGKPRYFLPVIGNSGIVECLFVATPPRDVCVTMWRQALYVRCLWHILQALRPVLARAAETQALTHLHRSFANVRQLNERVEIPSRSFSLEDAIADSKASSLAVLVQSETGASNTTRWVPVDVANSPNKPPGGMELTLEQLSDMDTNRLDQIAKHPTGRGLVLNHTDTRNVFRTLMTGGRRVAVYVKPAVLQGSVASPRTAPAQPGPQGRQAQERLLLVFFFDEGIPNPGSSDLRLQSLLDGSRQHYLSLIARYVAEAEFNRRRLQHIYAEELELFSRIGKIMSERLSDPGAAEKEMLQELKKFFKVSSVSINDVCQVQRKEGTRREVRMRCGIGYSARYQQTVYQVDSQTEGKTGFVVRAGRTLVCWRINQQDETMFQYLWNPDNNALERIEAKISGRDRCKSYLPEGGIYCFLGAPIWLNTSYGKEVIGVLKIANRTGDLRQRFEPDEIQSANRIAGLLGPILYLLQNRSLTSEKLNLHAITLLMQGLGHEVSTPIGHVLGTIQNLKRQLCASSAGVTDLANRLNNIERYAGDAMDSVQALQELWLPPEELRFTEIAPVVEEAIRSITPKFTDVQVRTDGLTPRLCMPLSEGRLRIVVDNLIRNACEAALDRTRSEAPTIMVETVVNAANGEVQLRIRDNGPGVSPEMAENDRLFMPFHSSKTSQLNEARRRVRGLGLFMAYLSVTLAGGRISFDRDEAAVCPTVFQVVFPLQPEGAD
ncbi:hypothetical protein D3093_15355 (plasmid) [Azospirillum argentinense]|uniref:Histidine kinase domain-containing protein n=1 Tax=Azospirillum argentinense TaxID=2970906 RepID=A0A4D8PJR3_9PROT|nr:ATP-binding protein [Azospirillum argentinense]QCN96707.1 hypothetical protein D3093_15355 [Azospirillum argentinense]